MISLTAIAVVGGSLFVCSKVIEKLEARKRKRRQKSAPTSQIQTFSYEGSQPVLVEDRVPVEPSKHEVSKSPRRALSKNEREVRKNMIAAVASLGLAIGGFFVFTPLAVLSVIPFFWVRRDVFTNAYRAWKYENRFTVDTLAAIAFPVCIFEGYFVMCGVIATTYCVSRMLVLKVKDDSRQKLVDIWQIQPKFVYCYINGVEVEKPLKEIQIGETVLVHPGAVVPVDGVVVEGTATVDQHMLTGESQLVHKGEGDRVYAATVSVAGNILIRVEKTGQETTVAQITQVLNKTIEYKTGKQIWAEEITDQTVLPTLMISALGLPYLGPAGAATVLYSHFNTRMITMGSLSMLSYFNLASQQGLLIKDGRSFELINKVDTIIFDKTGTLTHEQPTVGKIHAYDGYSEQTILAYAVSAESKQTHPIARAIQEAAACQGLTPHPIQNPEYEIGYGLTATIQGTLVRVGSERLMRLHDISIPFPIQHAQQRCHEQGFSLVMVAIEDRVVGGIELHPSIRSEANNIVKNLRQRGIQSIIIISGDHPVPTQHLAEQLGVDEYFAEVLPEQKADLIAELQQEGKVVCFVGDGINDSIALKKAHVSISLKGASTIAQDTAQIILMNQSLEKLDSLFDLADEMSSNMKMTFGVTMLPFLLSVGGVFLLYTGIFHAVILGQIGVYGGLASVAWPRIKRKLAERKQKKQQQLLAYEPIAAPLPPITTNLNLPGDL